QTMVYARRIEAERKAASAQPKEAQASEVPLVFRNSARIGIVDAKGSFSIKNLQPGNYRIDPREPASGWYVKSITIGPAAKLINVTRDGLTLKTGEHASGLTITVAEGASQLVGKIAPAEGQSMPPNLR